MSELRVYLASPANQAQAQVLVDAAVPVLLSFADAAPGMIANYGPAFASVLVDSGAYAELAGRKSVDIVAYKDFVAQWQGRAVACAGLDDIRGDWKRSLENYAAVPGTFPTFHDTDPDELLGELIPIAREAGGWIGIGLMPPRTGRGEWLRRTLKRLPDDLHVHGWALRRYRWRNRLDSVDSSNWYRDSEKILTRPETRHLTPVEALRIVVLRYQRELAQEEPCETLSLSLVG